MSAEDYHDVPGIGGGTWIPRNSSRTNTMACKFCGEQIKFIDRKAFNMNGSLHKCKTTEKQSDQHAPHEATLYALGAMNAIISGQIQAGGVDFIHRMYFPDVADAAWRMAVEMVRAERQHCHEFSEGGAA